jgi:hypothetical protein
MKLPECLPRLKAATTEPVKLISRSIRSILIELSNLNLYVSSILSLQFSNYNFYKFHTLNVLPINP